MCSQPPNLIGGMGRACCAICSSITSSRISCLFKSSRDWHRQKFSWWCSLRSAVYPSASDPYDFRNRICRLTVEALYNSLNFSHFVFVVAYRIVCGMWTHTRPVQTFLLICGIAPLLKIPMGLAEHTRQSNTRPLFALCNL